MRQTLPLSGLAPILVKEIFKAIDLINKTGATILLVEQDVQISLSLRHRGYILENGENGQIVMESKGQELLQNPQIKEAYLGMRVSVCLSARRCHGGRSVYRSPPFPATSPLLRH